MQSEFLGGVSAFVLALGLVTVLPAQVSSPACKPVVLEGSVRRGSSWEVAISPSLNLKVEAVPAGWMVRVLHRGSARPPHDAAELANPPYLSPTPILISTDFAFRAQDAIAWNPRRFRFFVSGEDLQRAESIYQTTLRTPDDAGAAARLYPMLLKAPEAILEIVDADLVGGTANQSAAAAAVASHFEQTAHTVQTELPATPLGTLLGLRFRLSVPALTPNCRRQ